MNHILRVIFDWSEVWALLIPIPFILLAKNTEGYLNPVKWFVWISLFLNLTQMMIWYRYKIGLPEFPPILQSNTFIYNLLSITRLITFSFFFILLRQRFMHRLKKIIPIGFIVFVLINFIFFEPFFTESVSSHLLATEAALLLFFCIQYFIFLLIESQSDKISQQKGFWVVTGLSIYVAVNFFIFLFYTYLTNSAQKFAVDIWDVHNVVLIILCIFIAIQFKQKNDR